MINNNSNNNTNKFVKRSNDENKAIKKRKYEEKYVDNKVSYWRKAQNSLTQHDNYETIAWSEAS